MRKLIAIMMILCLASAVFATALTAERNTPYRVGKRVTLPVAGGEKIFAGSMVAQNNANSGLVTNAVASGTTLQVIGRAASTVDNSAGTNGQKTIDIDVGVFGWANFGGVSDANIGDICYVVDDQTVSVTNVGSSVIAGVVFDVDGTYVWVDTGERDKTAGAYTTLAVSGAATFGSTLVVTGAVSMASTLGVTGDVLVGGDGVNVGPGATIYKWQGGTNKLVAGVIAVTFPEAFSATPIAVSVTPAGIGWTNTPYTYQTNWTTTGFTIVTKDAASALVTWTAVGEQ